MWLAVHERLFFLVKFWSKIWLRFPGWELHWLLNEDHTYLLWSGVMELSCMSAKLVSVFAPRSWKSAAFLDSSLPPTCTHTHRAPELLKVETLTPKGHLFFCHHCLANDNQGGAFLRGASLWAPRCGGLPSLFLSLSSCLHGLHPGRRLEKTIQCCLEVSVWQWPRTNLSCLTLTF